MREANASPGPHVAPLLLALDGGKGLAGQRNAPRLWQSRPVIVTSNMDAAATMTRLRLERGMTGEEVDDRAGLPDRYTAKLENPSAAWGKRGLQISPMWEVWAETLGVCLVILTKDQARQLGAVPAVARPRIDRRPEPARLAGDAA